MQKASWLDAMLSAKATFGEGCALPCAEYYCIFCCDQDIQRHWPGSTPGRQQGACAAFGLRSRGAVAFATPLQPGQLLLLEYGDQHMMRTVHLTPSASVASASCRPASAAARASPVAAAVASGAAVMGGGLGARPVVIALAASPDGRLIAAATSRGLFLAGQHAAAGAVQLSPVAAAAVAFVSGGERLLASRGAATECWDVSAAASAARLLCLDG